MHVHSKPSRNDIVRCWIGESVLGATLVCVGERGIRAVRFGDSIQQLQAEAALDFPEAGHVDAPDAAVAAVIAAIADGSPNGAGPARDLDPIGLDPQGTPFQRLVWAELGRTSRGETITYGDLARRIGRPRAVRAVAQACAANAIGVLIPCHRVLPRQGGIGGYRWGGWRKRRLLELESAGQMPLL
ncbi:MAG: methylated-DNA--[protein]-cysteine S-methyltransferase [Vicinamibacterales bacterium]